MDHTAKIISNPNDFAHGIVHHEGHIQHAQRQQFMEQHQIQAVGTNAVAFSVICCDDPATAERHTVHLPDEVTADEMRAIMEHHVQQHARSHAAAVAAVAIVRELAAGGVECKECK